MVQIKTQRNSKSSHNLEATEITSKQTKYPGTRTKTLNNRHVVWVRRAKVSSKLLGPILTIFKKVQIKLKIFSTSNSWCNSSKWCSCSICTLSRWISSKWDRMASSSTSGPSNSIWVKAPRWLKTITISGKLDIPPKSLLILRPENFTNRIVCL